MITLDPTELAVKASAVHEALRDFDGLFAEATRTRAPLARIVDRLAELGPDELRVVERIAERLVMGRTQYGPLDLATDKRDMRREASEEALDAAVYLAAELLRERPAGARVSCTPRFHGCDGTPIWSVTYCLAGDKAKHHAVVCEACFKSMKASFYWVEIGHVPLESA